MKRDKLVWSVIGVALTSLFSIAVYQGCSTEVDRPVAKNNSMNINHATEVYEVEFDGQKYIVVQTYKGIGVCKK